MTLGDVLRLVNDYAGRGPHSITGPVEVRGAQPGQVLRVDVLELDIDSYGFNLFRPAEFGQGLLPDEFPDGHVYHFHFDLESMTVPFGDHISVDLQPFLGIMGVAPAEPGPHHSAPPGPFGGNLDLRDLVEGTTLYLPVLVDGAGFYVGDAHARQGDGEVCLTALETSMKRARLRLTLVDEEPILRPRAETGGSIITLGLDKSLEVASRQAVLDMIRWLELNSDLTREQAYSLCSIAVDLSVTQLVNGVKGVHAKLPTHIFDPPDR
jgi:acetamidase/formamidase